MLKWPGTQLEQLLDDAAKRAEEALPGEHGMQPESAAPDVGTK